MCLSLFVCVCVCVEIEEHLYMRSGVCEISSVFRGKSGLF